MSLQNSVERGQEELNNVKQGLEQVKTAGKDISKSTKIDITCDTAGGVSINSG